MKFHKVLRYLANPVRKENPLSNLYGYRRNSDGTYAAVKNEADIITKVITTIATSNDPLDKILDKLIVDLETTRNRSGRRWTAKNLMALCKYVYAGRVITDLGLLIPSNFYTEIVPLEICRNAIKKVRQYQKSQ